MHPSNKKYDILIVGSGMGGLVCGAILSKEGYKVCVLEKNKQLGGCLQTYSRDKVIFDSGVHYLGGLDPGQNLYQIFKYLGLIGKLKLQRMDNDCFDKIIFEGDPVEYDLAQGYENFIAKLLVHFPDEEQALRTYCDKIKEICGKFPLYNLRTGEFYNEKAGVLELDTRGYIESITKNKRLQEVLAGNNALYAGVADKTPFYVHALILNSYIESSWKCVDGGSQIGRLLGKSIREYGGEIFRNTEVKKFVEEGGKITHVELSDGSNVFADHFISNLHPTKTMEMTVSDVIKKAYRNRMKSLENSISCFTLNVVFKKNTFRYFKYNYYSHKEGAVWTGMDYTEEDWPRGYAIFVHAYSRSPGYAEGMTLLAYMHFSEVEKWANTFNTTSHEENRGEDYEAFKKRKSEILLESVEKKFPGIRDCVKSYYAATPLSYRDYIGNDDGSLYGVSKDYQHPLKTFISPRTKMPNLYLTGQNLNLHGVLGTAMSGLITSAAFIGIEELVRRIKNA
ncbi:MAG TPA: NAD(P)/FAD-dependent oxidoreductase [Bacteroidia bacterium]|nr:NAD(P)/FAD-dependent oxidoreductase [Bacteroidia bacterium]